MKEMIMLEYIAAEMRDTLTEREREILDMRLLSEPFEPVAPEAIRKAEERALKKLKERSKHDKS